jgi:Undecaprenyl-phosphate galactose phosphotransferase WbaP
MLDSRGPIVYSQKRLGRGNKPFKVYKFRSMVKNADEVLKEHLAAYPELRREWEETHKLKDDPRVTRVGRFIRRYSLDELPQLWNVLKGDMSLVGPRPIVDAEVARYDDAFGLYCLVRPGMTGYWQVSGRSNTSYERRVELDSFYIRNWSIWLDITILMGTVGVVVYGDGAY